MSPWPRPDKRHSSTGSCPGLEAIRGRCAPVEGFRRSRRQSKQSSASMSRGGRTAARPQSVGATLRDYALPRLGSKRVSVITAADVMSVLLPIWTTKAETAKRVRQRIGAVMKWAVGQGYRQDNPAGDAISAALPNNGAGRKHQRALPHSEVAAAITLIRGTDAYRATVLASSFWFLRRLALERSVKRGGMRSTWTPPRGRFRRIERI